MKTKKSKIWDYATCNNCDMDFDLFYHYSRDMRRLKKCVDSGHTVHRECTSFIDYN